MADDAAQRQVMTLDYVLEEQDQGVDLLLAERLVDPAVGGFTIALVDQFDAQGAGVQPGTALPFAFSGMPGTAVLVHQAVDLRGLVADQVVAADAVAGQHTQGAVHVGGGVVQHHVLHAAALAHRGVAVVDAQPAGTASEQQQQGKAE
ncbi:hypothetical protein D3C72_1796830 [compost metagenome]